MLPHIDYTDGKNTLAKTAVNILRLVLFYMFDVIVVRL